MNESEVIKIIEEVIIQQLNISSLNLSREMTAQEIDGWDSLAHVQILVSIEKSFNCSFTLKDIKRLKNIGDLVDLVIVKLGSK